MKDIIGSSPRVVLSHSLTLHQVRVCLIPHQNLQGLTSGTKPSPQISKSSHLALTPPILNAYLWTHLFYLEHHMKHIIICTVIRYVYISSYIYIRFFLGNDYRFEILSSSSSSVLVRMSNSIHIPMYSHSVHVPSSFSLCRCTTSSSSSSSSSQRLTSFHSQPSP